MMDVVQHVEDSVGFCLVTHPQININRIIQVIGIKRSHIHKDPPWEREVCRLVDDHTASQLLTPVKGRKYASKKDHVKDYLQEGSTALQDKDGLQKYAEQRNLYLRARSDKQELDHFMSSKAQPQPPSMDPPPQTPLLTPLLTPGDLPGSPSDSPVGWDAVADE